MASVNKVILIGNVGRDPEIRYTQAGEPIANFTLATNEVWNDKSGQKQERTEWHRVEVFGKTAQVVRDYVHQGPTGLHRGQHPLRGVDGQGRQQAQHHPHPRQRARVPPGHARRPRRGRRTAGGRSSGGASASESQPPAEGGEEFQASDDDVPF